MPVFTGISVTAEKATVMATTKRAIRIVRPADGSVLRKA